ncbi:hypothetical protein V0288_22375 [Pannus brasiliensis CCIBt3594]|uniref:Transposase n=1 Tax=Pannus brasiliensis CCIBt3594 TaxID=1427578 RepID=A0AAW9QQ41_9CHRO
MNTTLVAIDIGNDVSIAVTMTREEFERFPPNTNAEDFYNSCKIHKITPDIEGLTKLLELGDLYIFEPTGNYSQLWHNNLLKAGKEVRLLSHDQAPVIRKTCRWNYKDDEHDAVAIAYYGWMNLNNPRAFNRTRKPDLHAAYLKILEKERINKELRVSKNRGRNLLHTEFPEGKDSKSGRSDKNATIWGFIAGEDIPKRSKTLWKNRLAKSIGTACERGFSEELKRHAAKIWQLETERGKLKHEFEILLTRPEYQWCKPVFDKFEFGTFDRVIALCQFDPFGQFLTEDLKELRLEKKRRKGKAGKYITKRVGYNRFHSLLGKAVKPWSSGDKEGHIVTGSSIARSHLHLWANRNVVMLNRTKNPIFQELRKKYEEDISNSNALLEKLLKFSLTDLNDLKNLLKQTPAGETLLDLIEDAVKAKKDPLGSIKSRGKQRLGNWARARISDRAVKMLFKELIGAYRRALADPNT